MYSKGAWFPIPLCKIDSLKNIWPKMTVNIWKSCMCTAVKKLWDRSDPRSFSPPRLLLWQTAFRLSVYFVKPPFREIGAGWGSMGIRCVLGGVGSLHIFCSFLSFVIFFFFTQDFLIYSQILKCLPVKAKKKLVRCPKAFLVILCSVDPPWLGRGRWLVSNWNIS